MKTFSTLLFCFSVIFVWSQNSNFTMDVSQLRAETVYFDIEGTPYLDDNYRLGHVFHKGEKLIFFLCFNALEDRVELKDRTKQLYYLQKNFILEPTFGAKSYKYVYYLENENDLKKGYMVLLEKGEKISLLFKPRKIYKQAESPDHGYDSFSSPKYRGCISILLPARQGIAQTSSFGERSFVTITKRQGIGTSEIHNPTGT